MPLTIGTIAARVWRVTDQLPQNFKTIFERNLQRHAFRPVDPDRGELQQRGWVNIRQMLDAELDLEKTLFGNYILIGLRQDRLIINPKLFRAMFNQELHQTIQTQGHPPSREQRAVLEDAVRMQLLKKTHPNTAVYEVAWNLVEGIVFFSSTSSRVNHLFADLFTETFQVSLMPQYPFMRAQTWAKRQNTEQELLELLPAPFSPDIPVETVEVMSDESDPF